MLPRIIDIFSENPRKKCYKINFILFSDFLIAIFKNFLYGYSLLVKQSLLPSGNLVKHFKRLHSTPYLKKPKRSQSPSFLTWNYNNSVKTFQAHSLLKLIVNSCNACIYLKIIVGNKLNLMEQHVLKM